MGKNKVMAHQRGTAAQRATRIFRHFVFLMIGALLAVPYIVVFIWATQIAGVQPASAAVAFGILLALIGVPALLSVTRALERTAVRELLGVELAEPVDGPDGRRRWRGAAWFVVHLMAGGLTIVTVAFAIPVILTVAGLALTGGMDAVTEVTSDVVPAADTATAVLWALGLGLGLTIFNVLAGIALPHWARIMLGPTSAERQALDKQRARAEARRNKLARDLHDSVGHALTVTTLQATAAQGMLTKDPQAAAQAMQAVSDTGRAALAELDQVIGILRSGDDVSSDSDAGNDAGADPDAGQLEGLRDLSQLLDRLAGQGLEVGRNYDDGWLGEVPAAASHAAYKVLQEGLTNALKYARPAHADLRITQQDSWLRLWLTNPVNSAVSSRTSGGRGLDGMRERARLVGGTVQSGMAGGVWSLRAEFPLTGGSEGQA